MRARSAHCLKRMRNALQDDAIVETGASTTTAAAGHLEHGARLPPGPLRRAADQLREHSAQVNQAVISGLKEFPSS